MPVVTGIVAESQEPCQRMPPVPGTLPIAIRPVTMAQCTVMIPAMHQISLYISLPNTSKAATERHYSDTMHTKPVVHP
jgi:hypothetical protein